MPKKYYITPKIERMIQKPFSLINAICLDEKIDTSAIRRALESISSDALVCIEKDKDFICIAKIEFGYRYGSDSVTVEEFDNNDFNVPIETLKRCFFYQKDRSAFLDIEKHYDNLMQLV